MMTVEPYQGSLGKCWLTPDGKIYYGDRLAPTHVEVTPPPSADHTVYDDVAQEWKMSYMTQVEGAWVEDPELKAAYDARLLAEANAPAMAALIANDAQCIRPAREFMAALLAETSNITAAETVSDLKAALTLLGTAAKPDSVYAAKDAIVKAARDWGTVEKAKLIGTIK